MGFLTTLHYLMLSATSDFEIELSIFALSLLLLSSSMTSYPLAHQPHLFGRKTCQPYASIDNKMEQEEENSNHAYAVSRHVVRAELCSLSIQDCLLPTQTRGLQTMLTPLLLSSKTAFNCRRYKFPPLSGPLLSSATRLNSSAARSWT